MEYYDKSYDRVSTKNERPLRRINRIFHKVTTTDDPIIRQASFATRKYFDICQKTLWFLEFCIVLWIINNYILIIQCFVSKLHNVLLFILIYFSKCHLWYFVYILKRTAVMMNFSTDLKLWWVVYMSSKKYWTAVIFFKQSNGDYF